MLGCMAAVKATESPSHPSPAGIHKTFTIVSAMNASSCEGARSRRLRRNYLLFRLVQAMTEFKSRRKRFQKPLRPDALLRRYLSGR